MITTRNRYEGCLLGLAVGDALGATVEFMDPGTFKPLTDIVGGGPHTLQAGQWTDDTSMALCLADSLIHKGFDPKDQMDQYVAWWQGNHYSSKDRCFDIGGTTARSLHNYMKTGNVFSGTGDPQQSGNGSIMRLAPVPMFAKNLEELDKFAAESSKTTHGSVMAIDSCRYFAKLLYLALNMKEASKINLFYEASLNLELCPEVMNVAAGSFFAKQPPEIKGSGFVIESLEAALWAFWNSDNFESGALLAVNLGDDADTTGAVYGQIAGAFYGRDGIPAKWQKIVYHNDTILVFAQLLYRRKQLDF